MKEDAFESYDTYSDSIYKSYNKLSQEELGLLSEFYSKLSKLQHRDAWSSPEMFKRIYNSIFQSSPKLQWSLLWGGLLLTVLLASSVGFITAYFMNETGTYSKSVVAGIGGGLIGACVCFVMANIILKKQLSEFRFFLMTNNNKQ